MNLGRLTGLRLHRSRAVRQGAQPLLREMSSAASPAQGCQPSTGSAVPPPVSIPESRIPVTASPARPAPDPASTRPSPPCAKATRWSCRNSTVWQGPSWMPAPSPIGFGNGGETGPRPDALRPSDSMEICSSISSPHSPRSKPISSACAPARAWPSPTPGGNCAASSPSCPTDSGGDSAALMPRVSIPSAISPSSSPSQDQPSFAHSTGSFPLSVRSCPYRNRPQMSKLLVCPPLQELLQRSVRPLGGAQQIAESLGPCRSLSR